MADEDWFDAYHGLLLRTYRRHLFAFFGVNAALTLVNIAVGGGWWAFWPLFVWGIPLAFHFFYVKSVTVDDEWVAERTEDLRFRSYDFGHMHDIEGRIKDRDQSVRPSDERD